jgi:hypothetical protein
MKKIFISLLILLLIASCTSEQTKDNQEQNILTSERSQETKNENSNNLDISDFPGADRIVEYSGQLSQELITMESELNEDGIRSLEIDEKRIETYNFNAVRVFYDQQSILYLTNIDGTLEYNFKQTNTVSETKAEVLTASGETGMIKENLKFVFGTIDADGEVEFSLYADYYNNSYNRKATGTKIEFDGQMSAFEKEIYFSQISIGGGENTECESNNLDELLDSGDYCKLYVNEKGSITGTFTDLNYETTRYGFANTRLTTSWELTPINLIDEPIYI